MMVSHLNIGVHARIGMGFELNKGDSSIGNKWVQAFEGFKKMMCMVTPKVDKMVSLVEIKVEGERRDKQTYRTLFSSSKMYVMKRKNRRRILIRSTWTPQLAWPVSTSIPTVGCRRCGNTLPRIHRDTVTPPKATTMGSWNL